MKEFVKKHKTIIIVAAVIGIGYWYINKNKADKSNLTAVPPAPPITTPER